MPIRMANGEGPDQMQSDLGLPCLSRPFKNRTAGLFENSSRQ